MAIPAMALHQRPDSDGCPTAGEHFLRNFLEQRRHQQCGQRTNCRSGREVTNGLFTVVLGDTTLANMTAISASLFTQPNLQLRIWFNDGVNGFAALSPVQNLTPAPYAVFAKRRAICRARYPPHNSLGQFPQLN